MSRLAVDGWRRRLALVGRPEEAVPGLDDPKSLRRIFVTAFSLWALGSVSFVTVVSRTEPVTVITVTVYAVLGAILLGGAHIALRTHRMPGLVLLSVILWTSALGAVSDFYYEMTAVTTVALCTAFVSWLGTRLAPLYATATVGGLFVAGALQGDEALVDRTVVVTLAVAFAVTIVGRSSDASRTAHHDREVLMERLAHESRHDELTGVGNRKLLIEQTHITLASDVEHVALALVDLDDFKTVNDSFGHAVGDEVLVAMAERITSAISGEDVVTRVGGDEFAVLYRAGDRTTDDLLAVLQDACNFDLAIGDAAVAVRASIGIVMADRADVTLKDLLAGADNAMYGRKRASRTGRAELHLR